MNKLIKLFISPNEFFNELKVEENHSYKKQFILIIFLSFLSAFLTKNLYLEYFTDLAFKNNQLNAIEFGKTLYMQGIISIVMASVLPIGIIALKSYLINGMTSFAGYGELKDSLAVVSYSYIIVTSGKLLASVIGIIINKYGFGFNIGFFLEIYNSPTVTSIILKEFDIFTIWYEILVIIGISKLYNVSLSKASVFVLGTWISYIFLSFGFAVMTI